ncbi:MAG: endo-1,4-beta-xylanase [Actinomycetes bacterium]
MRSRRRWAAAALLTSVSVALLAACGPSADKPAAATDLPSLARARGIALGVEVDQTRFASVQYRNLVAENFTSITPNPGFKMKWVEVEPGTFDFHATDDFVNWAADNHLRVRACCLSWYISDPAWVTSRKWTRPQLAQVLKTYITTVVSRYRGRVAEWDVVNEGLAPQGTTFALRKSIWERVLGPSYIALAFKWTHEADPEAQLYYNETSAEEPNEKFAVEYKMVQTLQRAGVPLTGVGLQMHRRDLLIPTKKQVHTVLGAFAAIGVRTEITEMDQGLPLPASDSDLVAEGRNFQQMTEACLLVRLCTGVTIWGVDDKSRYQQLINANRGAATLFDRLEQPKPAYYGVRRALQFGAGPTAAARASPGSPA